jgi:chromosomal replication initiation ATPase DnaA
MTTLEYRNYLANKLIKEFVENFKNQTGLKIAIRINDDQLLDIISLDESKEKLPIISLSILQDIILKNMPYSISSEEFKSKDRRRQFVDARIIFSHIARRLNFNFSYIGKYTNRDHTTIIHQSRKCEELLDTDPTFTSLYHLIINKITKAYAKTAE